MFILCVRSESDRDRSVSAVVRHHESHSITSLLAAGFFSKGHLDERLVIANANCVGRDREDRVVWPSGEEGVPRPCLVPFSFMLDSLSS